MRSRVPDHPWRDRNVVRRAEQHMGDEFPIIPGGIATRHRGSWRASHQVPDHPWRDRNAFPLGGRRRGRRSRSSLEGSQLLGDDRPEVDAVDEFPIIPGGIATARRPACRGCGGRFPIIPGGIATRGHQTAPDRVRPFPIIPGGIATWTRACATGRTGSRSSLEGSQHEPRRGVDGLPSAFPIIPGGIATTAPV